MSYELSAMSCLYKTGDLARWLSHGEIEFLGRLDQQVKIRGYRIELEEIEELLVKHEGVQAAVLVAKGNSTGDKYLAAYVVYGEAGAGGIDGVPTTTELREYLARRLPHYMVPSYFIPVDKMPLTPNGKIDRKALPEPDQSRPDLGATYVAPGTEKEEAVTNIWKQVLELERVGIYDNFFELGGNSLNIIQLSEQLTKVFKKDIPVAILFKYLTIRSFVDYVIGEEQELDSSNYRVNRRSEIMRSRKRFKQRLSRRVGGIA
jgi:acyl carrier protein